MDKKKQFEALARLDGYEYVRDMPFKEQGCLFSHPDKVGFFPSSQLPNYDSHDALQRIIDGLIGNDLEKYLQELTYITCGEDDKPRLWYEWAAILKATPAQKREAILKAKGLWEVNNGN